MPTSFQPDPGWYANQRLSLLAELIAEYEAEHGVITDDELAAQEQADRDAAAMNRATGSQAALSQAAVPPTAMTRDRKRRAG